MLETGKARRPISAQLSIAAFLLSLLIASIVGYVFYLETNRLAIQNNTHYLQDKNNQIKTLINAIYKEAFDHLTFISQFPPVKELVRRRSLDQNAKIDQESIQTAELLKSFLQTRQIYTGVSVVELNSRQEIVSVNKTLGDINISTSQTLQSDIDFSFIESIEKLERYKAMFTDVNFSGDNTASFDMALPLYHKNAPGLERVAKQNEQNQGSTSRLNTAYGLVIIRFDFYRFVELINIFSLSDLNLFLADKNSQLLYSNNMSDMQRNRLEIFFPNLIDSIEGNIESDFLYVQSKNEPNELTYSVFQRFQSVKYGEGQKFVWLLQPAESLLVKGLIGIESHSLMISFGLSILVFLLSLIATKRLTRPLSMMIKAIQDDEQVLKLLPIDANDEIGVLARTFYNMQLLKDEKDKQLLDQQYALDQHAIVSATDLEGTIIFANQKFSETSGYSNDELVGSNHRILNSHFHDTGYFEEMYNEISHGKVWRGEICNRTKDGKIYWVNSTIVPFLDESSKPYQYISIRTNITDKKNSEIQLIKAKIDAENAVHAKSEFFASMSHEIRTPMNGVLGMLGLIMRTKLDKQQKHYATLARSSADSLLAIIDDILDLSKIEAGKIELEILDFDLREQLGIFAESMGYRAQDKGLEMILDVTGVEHSMVKGDPGRLRQILTNLAGNAIKFTEQGEISIKAVLTSINEQEWNLHCEISDSGIGIPADKIDGLFNTYSQVDSSTTRKFGGTGLGLAIVKQLTQLMKGNVRVESEFGKGSQFCFDIVLGVSHLSEFVVPKQDVSGKNILVVDDNPTNLEVLVGQLVHWGANAFSATSGKQALEILEQKSFEKADYFDIAILDMGMPDMDGAQLGQIIRDNNRYDHLKLVMMTSMASSGDISKFKHIGFSAYFPKPATTHDLLHALQVLVEDGKTLAEMDGMVTNYNISNMTSTSVFSNARILLVEDNPINQEVALGILSDMGVMVDIAENGLEAIEKLKNNEQDYGMVIMDCQMPEMDGYEATREIRSNRHPINNHKIPIVAMTANALKGDRQKCLDAGMNDYLTKPVDPNELEDKLRGWLPQTQQDHHIRQEQSVPISELELQAEKVHKNRTSQGGDTNELHDDLAEDLIWNQSALMKRVRNNKKLAEKLVNLFKQDLPVLKESLRNAFNSNNLEEIVTQSHKIKGSAANLSAVALSKIAATIEHTAREKSIPTDEQTQEFYKQVEHLLKRLNAYTE